MPLDKAKQQRYYEVTVYFKTGTKKYSISPEKLSQFMKESRGRKDVIKITKESVYRQIY